MRRILIAVITLLSFAAVAFAQARHPFTFDDMMKLKRVDDPQVSPDGKWVIYSVVDVDLAANTRIPHIWIVPISGGQERELTSAQAGERPRWAPDGKRFAFTSTKQNGSQIWIADFDNAAGTVTGVHQLTNIATEASGEIWSPDGKNILFVSDVYPECDGAPEKEIPCDANKVKEAEQSKVKAQIFTHLLYRHWNAFKEGKRTHILVISAAAPGGTAHDQLTGIPRDLTPGDYDAPVFSLGGQDDYAFSPDGKEICYASNHDKNPAASTNNDLWIVPVTGGEAKNITADNPASDTSPLYSPDGRYIAYRAQQRPGYESDRFRLMLYDRQTRQKKNMTEDFDHWVGTYVWAPDSKAIYFSSEESGGAPLFRLGVNHESITRIVQGTFDEMNFAPDGKTLLLTQMSVAYPTRIEAVETGSVEDLVAQMETRRPKNAMGGIGTMTDIVPKVIADPNAHLLSEIDMQPLESYWFTGAHNDKVEGFVIKPPSFSSGRKYPVKFLIHGGPQGAWGDDWSYRWNPELFAANGYVIVMINFHGSTGYGQKFIDAINGDWGGAPFDDLMKGLDYAEQHYPFIDKNRECALGASYGGYAINWIEGHTDRFKCLVSHDGMFNAESAWGATEELWFNNWEFKGTPYDNRELYRKWSPHEYARNFKTPMLVIHGQRDYRLDVSQGFDLFTTLQMEGVPSEMLYFPDEGHFVLKPQNAQLWYRTVNAWVDRWIGK